MSIFKDKNPERITILEILVYIFSLLPETLEELSEKINEFKNLKNQTFGVKLKKGGKATTDTLNKIIEDFLKRYKEKKRSMSGTYVVNLFNSIEKFGNVTADNILEVYEEFIQNCENIVSATNIPKKALFGPENTDFRKKLKENADKARTKLDALKSESKNQTSQLRENLENEKKKVIDLNKEKENLQNKFTGEQEKNKLLEKEKSDLNTQLKSEKAETARLQKEKEKYAREKEEEKKRLKQELEQKFETERSRLIRCAEDAEKKYKETSESEKKQREELTKSNKDLEEKLKVRENELQDVKNQITALKNETKMKMDEAAQLSKEVNQQLEEITNKQNVTNGEKEKISSELLEKTNELTKINKEIDALKKENQKLNKQLSEFSNSYNTTIESCANQLNSYYHSAYSNLMQAEQQKHQNEISQLQKQIETLQQELLKAQEYVSSTENDIETIDEIKNDQKGEYSENVHSTAGGLDTDDDNEISCQVKESVQNEELMLSSDDGLSSIPSGPITKVYEIKIDLDKDYECLAKIDCYGLEQDITKLKAYYNKKLDDYYDAKVDDDDEYSCYTCPLSLFGDDISESIEIHDESTECYLKNILVEVKNVLTQKITGDKREGSITALETLIDKLTGLECNLDYLKNHKPITKENTPKENKKFKELTDWCSKVKSLATQLKRFFKDPNENSSYDYDNYENENDNTEDEEDFSEYSDEE